MPIHLASDYIHPYKDARVVRQLRADNHGSIENVFGEVDAYPAVGGTSPGGSITNSAETVAAGVILASELITPLVWIEPWPEESTGGQETFELVAFSSYEVVERAPYLGETRAWIGNATWKMLDRTTVEVLVGGKVQGKRYS